MTRKVYIVAEIDTNLGDFHMNTKVYTTYNRAVEAFKVKVAERLIFDAIHDLRIDNVPITGANIIEMFKDDKFLLTDTYGNESDLPFTEEGFGEAGGVITLKVDTLMITLRMVEEET